MVIQDRPLHANTDHLNLFRLHRYALYQKKQLVCSIPSPQCKKPLIWYWQWLWPEDLLTCTLSEKQKYLKYIFFSCSRYVDDVISRIGRMFPDVSIELFRPNGTSAVLLVRCFVLHRSLQEVFLYILMICILWSASEWQVLCLKWILVVVLDTFMGAQFDWLIFSVKQNKKYRQIFVE